MNTLECSFVVHHQLQSHSTDQNEYSAMSCIPYVTYISMCALKVSVWAGTNGHLLPLQYTTLFVKFQLVPNMVLCALGYAY